MREDFDDTSGTPSPDNVRAISGFTDEFTVTECGVNGKSAITTSSFGAVYHGYVDLVSGKLVLEN